MFMSFDPMRYSIVPPERCPACQSKAVAVEAAARLAGATQAVASRAGSLARCKGHQNV